MQSKPSKLCAQHVTRQLGYAVSAVLACFSLEPVPNYLTRANDEMCVIVQVETREAMNNLPRSKVEGVDGVFIGPADLSADMGFQGT